MIEVRYTLDPDSINGKESTIKTDKTYEESFIKQYNHCCKSLDLMMFLIDYFHIIESTKNDLCSFNMEEYPCFWKANEYLLNYVNAIYSFKEFINHKLAKKAKKIEKISNKYYYNGEWYRFICDYRNYVVHEGTLLRDYRKSDKELLLSIDGVIDELSAFTENDEKREQKKEEFIVKLRNLYPVSTVRRGKHYIEITDCISKINCEVKSLYDEIILKTYDCLVEKSIKWMLSHIHRIGDLYTYTIIDVDIKNDLLFEPNYTLESSLDYYMVNLGAEHEIVCRFIQLLKDKKYTLLYDSHMTIEGFDNRLLLED